MGNRPMISGKTLFLSTTFSLLLTFVLALLLAFFLQFYHLEGGMLGGLLMLITYVSIFLGGILSGRHWGEMGYLNGGILGFTYMMILLFLGRTLLAMDYSSLIFLRLFTGILCGGLGGIFGVQSRE